MIRVGLAIIQLVGRRVEATDVVVGMVVPAVGTYPKTHLFFVDHVQFRQHIKALRNRAAGGKITVAVVVVPRVGQLAVRRLHSLGVVELQGVVETNRNVFIARIELERLHRRHPQSGENRRGQQPASQIRVADLIVVIHLACSPFCGFTKSHSGKTPVGQTLCSHEAQAGSVEDVVSRAMRGTPVNWAKSSVSTARRRPNPRGALY
ncbi:hypothetical protein D3C71_1255890 [compost metagenome]